MRKIAFYIINLFVIGSLWSCQGDEPTTTSIFDEEEEVAETEFDQWLLHNYTSVSYTHLTLPTTSRV